MIYNLSISNLLKNIKKGGFSMILKTSKNSNRWLSKKEFDYIKNNYKDINTFCKYAFSLKTNECVKSLYDYFQERLPGFFNKLCNIIFACNIIDLRVDTIDENLYNRYLRYAKKYFNNKTQEKQKTYEDLFANKQYILLQRIPNGYKQIGLTQEEDEIYWWITKYDLKCLPDLVLFVYIYNDYRQCVNGMNDFISKYFSKPSIYMNEEKTPEQLKKIAEHKEQVRLKLIKKLQEIKNELNTQNT